MNFWKAGISSRFLWKKNDAKLSGLWNVISGPDKSHSYSGSCPCCPGCSSVTREAWTPKDRMASNYEVFISSASFIIMRSHLKTKNRKKSWWCLASFFRYRDRYSESDFLCDLRVENLHFSAFCRMSYSDFLYLPIHSPVWASIQNIETFSFLLLTHWCQVL
jgi:hypothetical protein